jgi:hypothetical protein
MSNYEKLFLKALKAYDMSLKDVHFENHFHMKGVGYVLLRSKDYDTTFKIAVEQTKFFGKLNLYELHIKKKTPRDEAGKIISEFVRTVVE